MNRAYSLITVKAVDEDKRILSGVATTPSTDRQGDIVEPKGAEFSLPIPFLWQHDASKPIGHVTKAKVTKDGIEVEIHLAKVSEPGTLKDRLDEAWQSFKSGLVRGLSIGFKALEFSRLEDGGLRFIKWSWLELSAVTIAANAEATITAIKAADTHSIYVGRGGLGEFVSTLERNTKEFDAQVKASAEAIDARLTEIERRTSLLAASGRERSGVVRLTPPGASGLPQSITRRTEVKKTFQEQITEWEAKRAAKVAEQTAIMTKAADEGRTLDAAEKEQHDTLDSEIKEIDEHLPRLHQMAKNMQTQAVEVKGADPATAALSRDPGRASIQVLDRKLDKGIGFARIVKCMAAAKGNPMLAEQLAKSWYPEYLPLQNIMKLAVANGGLTSEMTRKAAVAAGTTSDSDHHSALVNYQDLAGEFVAYLRPRTIIGQFGTGNIPALRRVPFNIRVPRQTTKSSASWVGEGLPKPLTSFNTEQITLDFFKCAGIIVATQELLRFSNPSAEALIRDDLAAAVIERIDIDFITPSNSGTANVKPAAITNGAVTVASVGDTAANVRTDVQALFAEFIQANIPVSSAVWVMNANVALALSMMMNDLGQPEFPGITMNGGTFVGLPVLVSQYVPTAHVVLIAANEVYLADDGNVSIAISTEASLEMLDGSLTQDGTAGTGASLVSMFQTNSVAIRAEREINWRTRRSEAVCYLTSANWGGTAGSGEI